MKKIRSDYSLLKEKFEIHKKQCAKIEDEMRSSKERFSALSAASFEAIFLSDKGICLDQNKAAEKMFGYSLKEAVGKPGMEWIIPEDRELVKNNMITGYEKPYKVTALCRDGSTFPAEIQARMIMHKQKNIRVTALRDITERKKAENALQKSIEKYKSLTNNLNVGIFRNAVETDAKFIDMNPAMIKMLGFSTKKEMRKLSITDVYKNPSDRKKYLKKLFKKGSVKNHKLQLKKKDGTEFTAIVSSVLVKNEKGEIQYYDGIIEDYTPFQKAQDEKIKAEQYATEREKHALVGRIAGKTAHDFNNILAVIMGNADLALLDCTDPQAKQTLELIFEQTLRGKNLTKNLIAFAKDQELKQEFFSINEKAELVISLLKKDLESINIIREYGQSLPELLADPGMIEHALVNLIQNSIHATSKVNNPEIIIKTLYHDNNICIKIKDNGCGIPEQYLERIYEPAFTMKGSRDISKSYKVGIKGTGYGMSNIRKYVEQHKGRISIHSHVNEGTKIAISFPVIRKELTSVEITQIEKKNSHIEKYILLVEDEPDISDVQYKILTHKPCRHLVDIAVSGQIAIDMFNSNDYDFISLDYVLPGEINGMDVYQHIRKTDKKIPILFVSGNLEFLESIKDLKHQDSYIDHISKPCQNKDYIDSINKLLDNSTVRDDNNLPQDTSV